MTKTFLTCTNCGQKSSDTKRCQHCGQVFGRPPQSVDDSSSKRSWFPVVAVIGVVAIIALGLQQWWQRPSVAPPVTVPETTTIAVPAETTGVTPPAPSAQKAPTVAPVESTRAAAPAPVEPRNESLPRVTDTATPTAPAPSAQPVAIDPARQRYANTWANVRSERSSSGSVVQVLNRGEIVAIDSLEGGWYRVTTDRPVVGYVDQQYLDTLPPGQP